MVGGFGNDFLDDREDRLDGAGRIDDSYTYARGQGTIDVLTGGLGADTFVLGEGLFRPVG